MPPLVSVIVPTYNHARFLGRALESVRVQSYPHWEALVVDNHSQDETDRVVTGFHDPRIHLFKIHNQGVIAASRNLGLREACGEWIAFLDSDDCWYPDKLQVVMAAVEADPAVDVLSNDELMVDIRTGARRRLRHGPYQREFYRTLLVDGNRLSTSATVVRREFIREHRITFDESEDYVTVEDYGFWLSLARAGARFRFIPGVQGEFVVHGANNSSQRLRHLRNGEALLRDHVFKLQQFDPSRDKLWKQVSSRLRLWEVQLFAKEHQYWPALRLAVKTFVGSPRGTCHHVVSRLRRVLRHAVP